MARPAEPMLASTLYSIFEKELGGGQPRKPRRVGTGCPAIDDFLEGGLNYGDGGVCCISGEAVAGTQAISYNLLVSHLLSHGATTATVIDSTGTFDVLKLHKCMAARITGVDTDAGRAKSAAAEAAAAAAQALDRVKIMRVFDFEGMLEGIEEMREDARRLRDTRDRHVDELDKIPRTTIADSQADCEGDEMLDGELYHDDEAEGCGDREHCGDGREGAGGGDGTKSYGMLVVDNMTQVVGAVMKSNHVQGHALLASSVRSLRHMAREYSLCAVLLNSTVTYRDALDSCSVFASITSQPALGKTLPYLVDTHLFVNRIARTARDAVQHEGSNSSSRSRAHSGWVNVVEVLQDRDSDRVGQFGIFTVDAQGLIKGCG
ncbi:hypothetical protein MBLNU459_g3602t1 [Dothideomycetes sp. NU459]